jgi:hypothetical protein
VVARNNRQQQCAYSRGNTSKGTIEERGELKRGHSRLRDDVKKFSAAKYPDASVLQQTGGWWGKLQQR